MRLTSTGRDEEPLVLHESVLVGIVKAIPQVMNVMKLLLNGKGHAAKTTC